MLESLLEAIDRLLSDKHMSWGAVITSLLFFNKIQRNKEFRIRDKRVERNQRRIMDFLGVDGEWAVDKPNWNDRLAEKLWNWLRTITSHVPITMLSTRHTEIDQSISRRKNMLTTILKANLSKKLISALVAMAIVALNSYLNLNINPTLVWGVLGLSASHITGQTIIDSIKAWALSKATMVVRTMPTVETVIQKIIADPNTSYTNMIPVINDVHNTFTSFLADMKKGKVTDATREAMSAYLTVQAYLQTIKTAPVTEPTTTIPEQVGA